MSKDYLITGYYFNEYTGSMMHICEIAQELSTNGWNVTIATMYLTEEIRNYVAGFKNVKVELAWHLSNNMHFDVALCYHFPILPRLLAKGFTIDKIIFGSLSGFVPLETPPLCLNGSNYYLQVHSHELFKQMIDEYGLSNTQLLLVPNMVPDEYYSSKRISGDETSSFYPPLKRVAVVSNHVPSELRATAILLSAQGVETIFHGCADRRGPITPEVLSSYDLVITIGKTVQYALALGIPVYEYDHFGGSGYITKANVNLEEMYNFSGRATRRKLTSDEICREILSQYEFALQNREYLRDFSRKYSLSLNVKAYYSNPDYLIPFNTEDEKLFHFSRVQSSFLSEELCGCKEQILFNELSLNCIQQQLNACSEYKAAYLSIANSHIWRYTAPLRKLLDWIKAYTK